MTFGEKLSRLKEVLLYSDIDSWRNPVTRAAVQLVRISAYLWESYRKHDTVVRAAALTFYTLMALVPVIAVVFAIVKGFGLAGDLMQNLYAMLPQSPEVVDYLVEFAERALARTQGGVMASVALVMLFWSVINVFSSIEEAFNNSWEVEIDRSLLRRAFDYLAIILIVPILWIVINAVSVYAGDMFGENHGWLFSLLSNLGAAIIICLIFTLLYIIIPNTKVRFTSALKAGLVSGIAFFLFQHGYIYAQKWMTSYNAIYGSFAALPLLLIWLEYSWVILLTGSEMAFVFQNAARFNAALKASRMSYDEHRRVLLAVTITAVRHFHNPGGAITTGEISRRLDLPPAVVNATLQKLVTAKVMQRVNNMSDESENAFAPAYDIAKMTLYGILEAVERCGASTLKFPKEASLESVDRALERLKERSRTSEDNIKLVDLI